MEHSLGFAYFTKYREIVNIFRDYAVTNGFVFTAIDITNELISVVEKLGIDALYGNTFVTFDFKELYTNRLEGDALAVLRGLHIILDLDGGRIYFIIDLYKFCNDSNYFNVGSDIFKQVKSISMVCCYSKEVSDLVLSYAEYSYQLISRESKDFMQVC